MNVNKKNSIFLMIFMSVIIILLNGCQQKNQDKEIKIGISSNLYPFNYYDSLSVAAGFEIDLINEFCNQNHLKPVFVQNTIPELLKDLTSSNLDLIISSVSGTSERVKVFSVSEPYYDGNQMIVCLQDSILPVKNIEECTPYNIGIQIGSSGQYLVEKLLLENHKIKPDKIMKEKSIRDLISGLKSHKTDIIIIDKTLAELLRKDEKLSFCSEISTGEKFSIIMPKETSYKTRINRFIKKYKKSEQYKQSLKDYFLGSND